MPSATPRRSTRSAGRWSPAWLAGAAALVGGSLGLFALRSGLSQVAVKRVEVTLGRLPRTLSGTRIVQLSDVHVGPTIHRQFIDTIVRQCNALTPDLVVITGDLVDGTVAELREHTAPLAGAARKARCVLRDR